MTQPIHPEGTPEYEQYTQELKVELGKFARGEEPYPFPPRQPMTREESAAFARAARTRNKHNRMANEIIAEGGAALLADALRAAGWHVMEPSKVEELTEAIRNIKVRTNSEMGS